jgi:hypothetical protein
MAFIGDGFIAGEAFGVGDALAAGEAFGDGLGDGDGVGLTAGPFITGVDAPATTCHWPFRRTNVSIQRY